MVTNWQTNILRRFESNYFALFIIKMFSNREYGFQQYANITEFVLDMSHDN